MATALKEQFVKDAEARVKELEPSVTEHQELVETLAAIKGETAKPAAPRASTPRRGRRGNRRQEFLKIVKENPGISVSEVASKMEIQPNYLYRLKGDLEKAGELKVEGRGLKVA